MHTLLGRVGPVLEPHQRAVEERIRPAGDVARRDDPGRGETGRVAHHAVVERQPGPFEPTRLRHHADADDDHIGLDDRTVAESDAAHLSLAVVLDAVDLHVGAQVDAVVAVYRGDHRSELGAEPADHRLRQHLQHRHHETAGTARCRDLGADEPGADHDDLRAPPSSSRSASASSRVRRVKSPARFGWPARRRGRRRSRSPARRRRRARRRAARPRGRPSAGRPRARRAASRDRGRRHPACARRADRVPSRRAGALSTAAAGRTEGAVRRRSRRCVRRSPRAARSRRPAARRARSRRSRQSA